MPQGVDFTRLSNMGVWRCLENVDEVNCPRFHFVCVFKRNILTKALIAECINNKLKRKCMKVKKKKRFSKPDLMVLRISMEQSILTMSGNGVSLEGAGVNESDADDNGNDIW